MNKLIFGFLFLSHLCSANCQLNYLGGAIEAVHAGARMQAALQDVIAEKHYQITDSPDAPYRLVIDQKNNGGIHRTTRFKLKKVAFELNGPYVSERSRTIWAGTFHHKAEPKNVHYQHVIFIRYRVQHSKEFLKSWLPECPDYDAAAAE